MSPAGLGALVTVAATTSAAAGLSWYVATGAGIDGRALARFLADTGSTAYAGWVWAVLLAPVALLAAAVLTRWTPWPWVVLCLAHLLSVVALVARLRHLVPDPAAVLAAALLLIGVASIGLVLAADQEKRVGTPTGNTGP